MAISKQWITYWRRTLEYANIKQLEQKNEPIEIKDFHSITRLNSKLAGDLWKEADAGKDVTSIKVALCPAVSSITSKEQHVAGDAECLYWIIVDMTKDSRLSLNEKSGGGGNKNIKKKDPYAPFFVRDYLSPNPREYTTISTTELVDKARASYGFNSKDLSDHFLECEAFFKDITGKTFKDYNTSSKWCVYVELAPKTGISNNILTLYNELPSELANSSSKYQFKLLSSLIFDEYRKKKEYPDQVSALTNYNHLGQFSGQFPLSRSQRVSMRGFEDDGAGDITAINGPPGTGKTTFLQSVVANLTVQRVLSGEPPALILASSSVNQAITNILSGFSLPDDGDPMAERWLPNIPSLGLYMSSSTQNDFLMYGLDRSRTTGFFAEYESQSPHELQDAFVKNMTDKLGVSVTTVSAGKKLLKLSVVNLQRKITDSIKLAQDLSLIDTKLADKGFKSVEALTAELAEQEKNLSKILLLIDQLGGKQEELQKAYDAQSFFAKLLRFLPRFKQRRASHFERIVCEMGNGVIEVDDWSDHYHIIERINQLLIQLHQSKHDMQLVVMGLGSYLKEIKNTYQAWDDWLAGWNKSYQDKLNKLYEMTGDEYQNLSPLEDVNIRLDISYRYESFWLAMHYREAEYTELLLERVGKRDAESMKNTYREKLQRYACLTPIFISTFHSAPKYSRYFDPGQGCTHPHYELYDCLIVDEAGQVLPEVSVPTFSLAQRALVVGDCEQIKPVYGIAKEMDDSNYLHYHDAPPNRYDCESLIAHERSGRLGASGSLMHMAQKSGNYQQQDIGLEGLLLTEHRRCLDNLISYSNDYVYSGQLEPKRGKKPQVELDFIKGNKGYVHIDNPSESAGKSRVNTVEAAVVAEWINIHHKRLIELYGKPIHEIVFVVTPYKPQSTLIKKNLKAYNLAFDKITVGTTHAMQGAERPAVLFSLVVSPQDSLNFVGAEYNMLNVAISRAKDYFVLFGNMNTLAASSLPALKNLREWLLDNPDAEIDDAFVYKLIRDKSQSIIGEPSPGHINDSKRHQEILEAAFQRAVGEISVVSPFLSIRAISVALQRVIKETVDRGVVVTVYCDARLDSTSGAKRKPNSVKAINKLLELGVVVKEIQGIHSKTIIFKTSKEYVLIEGSFNWLSAVRDINSPYHRYEASIILTGPKIEARITAIKKLLEQRSKPLLEHRDKN